MSAGAGGAPRLAYVCEGQDCGGKGSLTLVTKLQEEIAAKHPGANVELKTYPCFGGCGHGINVVVHPDRLFYSEVTTDDVPALAASLAGQGPALTAKTGKVEPDIADLAFDLVAAGF